MDGPEGYFCTGEEPAFSDIEVFDDHGQFFNIMVSSECFADWYCTYVYPGYTWRHKPPEVPPEPTEP
jgi:hypothetical protein